MSELELLKKENAELLAAMAIAHGMLADYRNDMFNQIRPIPDSIESQILESVGGAMDVLEYEFDKLPAQHLADIKADAVESILSLDFDCETSNSDVAYSTATIEEYANKLRSES